MICETISKLALLGAALIPLTLVNLRTGNIPNRYSLFLFAAGLAWMALASAMGWTKSSLPLDLAVVLVEAVVLVVALGVLKAPGGVGKALIALTPWFGLGTLFAVYAITWFAMIVVAKSTGRRSVLLGPPLLAVSLAAALV